MKDRPFFAVIYMFAVTAFFSAVLIGFARLTRDRVDANQQLAFEKAVLDAFPEIKPTSHSDIHRIFTEQFVKTEKSSYPFYYYRKDGKTVGYAVPVEGKGFWAIIKGVVGVAADKQIITGIAFYEQSETPGLGARIAEPDFCDQFKNLEFDDQGMPIGIRQGGGILKKNEVHSITGATQTCVRLEKLVNDGLAQWQEIMKSGEDF